MFYPVHLFLRLSENIRYSFLIQISDMQWLLYGKTVRPKISMNVT